MLNLPFRKKNPVQVSREAIEDFSFRIFPYFKDKNIHEWGKRHYGYPDSLKLMEKFVFYLIAHPNGDSHLIPNYQAAISIGFNRIKERARLNATPQRATARKPKPGAKFHQAIEIVSDGAIALANNYSQKCAALAAVKKTRSARQNSTELQPGILLKAPAQPAATFWEALESACGSRMLRCGRSPGLAVGSGRMDQFMLPFYERDLERRLD